MEKRTLLAIVLCILVIIFYQVFFAPKAPKVVPPQPQAPVPEKIVEVPKEEALPPLEIPIIESRDIIVETDLVTAVFTTQGARLKKYWLKKYDYKLVVPTEENRYPLSLEIPGQKGLVSENWSPTLQSFGDGARPDKERLKLSENNPTGELNFAYLNPQGLKIIKTLRFYNDSYKIDVKLSLHNITSQDVYIPEYRLSWGPGIGEEEKKGVRQGLRRISYLSATSWVDGKARRYPSQKIKDKIELSGKIDWTSLGNRYFLASLIPKKGETNIISKDSEGKLTVSLKSPSFTIPTREKRIDEFILYLGPKEYERLKAFNLRLEKTIGLGAGIIGSLSVLILKSLRALALPKANPNYGIAIILLTVVIKIILLPLTQKSFAATRAMQAIQPKINALREKHKDNPQELNRQMMRLYREHKVNPMGGCLPMLLQLPIWWALFMTLRSTIELRGAPFIWWIRDLSMPDTIPLGNFSLNILPILMGLTMLLQQKMTTVDPRQAKMGIFMGIFMILIFYSLPSGLVLYILVSNLLTIGQQYIIAKRVPATAK